MQEHEIDTIVVLVATVFIVLQYWTIQRLKRTIFELTNPTSRVRITMTFNETKKYRLYVVDTITDGETPKKTRLSVDKCQLTLSDVVGNFGTLEKDETSWFVNCGDLTQGPASANIGGTFTNAEGAEQPITGTLAAELGEGEVISEEAGIEAEVMAA